MTFQQTSFDFDDQTDNFFTNLYDGTGKTIGIVSGPGTFTGSGAISGAIGATGPSTWYTGYSGSVGYGNINYPTPTITFNDTSWTNNSGALDVKGDANFDGDIKVKGKSIVEALDKIEQRLAILHSNSALEEKWEELKELGNRYRELEKTILEKEKIVEILKK